MWCEDMGATPMPRWCAGRGEVAHVVRDDAAGGGVAGRLDERFVIRVVGNRQPSRTQRPFPGARANGIKENADAGKRQTQFGGVRFENLLLFVDEMIARHRCPSRLPQRCKCRE